MIGLGRLLGASWLLAVAIADAGLYVLIPRMICRAEVFGYLYFALALALLARYTRGRRLRSLAWLLPLAIALGTAFPFAIRVGTGRDDGHASMRFGKSAMTCPLPARTV